ncbi:class E sortase [Rhodococcus sp. ACT016]|uniref:class E sortase n=1 Tax=Rhodococcus sp. ACT016 TaxID=3134808 RepID=UPI003D2D2F89
MVLDAPATRAQRIYRGAGEALLTLALIGALFIVYEVYWTDLTSGRKQRTATEQLDQLWSEPDRTRTVTEASGPVGFAKLHIPAFGNDFQLTVMQGTSDADLEVGPGHYEGTAQPGERGNFALAGHRVGKGSPFNDIDLLKTCDAVVVETRTHWYTYRVLPSASEALDWATSRKPATCSAGAVPVTPLPAPYQRAVGQQVVDPSAIGVIAPVPMNTDYAEPPQDGAALLTLTTCTPRFSATHRLVVQAILVDAAEKDRLNPVSPKALSEG